MKIAIIAVPYDSGRHGWRMGAGPVHLLKRGLAQQLENAGHDVQTHVVEISTTDEPGAARAAAHAVAALVRNADRQARLPILLAGNCLASLGGVAGLNSRTVLLWLDAHADFNTPATSPSGFLDGMALSVITGRCHAELTSDLTGFAPLEDENLLMLGVRAVDEGEAALLQKVRRLRSSRELWHALAQTQPRDLYLHVDLDALDPSVVRANEFAAPHGLSLHTLHDVITTVKENKRIVALAITAYDPAYDVPDHGPQVVQDIIERVLA